MYLLGSYIIIGFSVRANITIYNKPTKAHMYLITKVANIMTHTFWSDINKVTIYMSDINVTTRIHNVITKNKLL